MAGTVFLDLQLARELWVLSSLTYNWKGNGGTVFLDLQVAREWWVLSSLTYSWQGNGGYCLPCVLFARSLDVGKGNGVLVETAFTNFKKMYEVCDLHAAREDHKDAMAVCDAFVERMSGKQESVLIQLREGARETIQNNRKKLCSITEIIGLCGRQNIALCGHRDSGTDMEGVQAASTNHDDFCALLNFRISAGDTILRDHLQSAARNVTYTSPHIQNHLLSILGDHICNAILGKVRSSLCYTLIADEVTECSNKEQLCIVIRYVEPETASIREDLITFLECDSGITGKALADKMLGFVRNYLEPSKMRGQAYDGASNMSVKTNRAAARISSQSPLVLYTHCTSYCLYLAVAALFEEVSIRNMIGVVKQLSSFFLHTPSVRRSWKKLYRTPSQNRTW